MIEIQKLLDYAKLSGHEIYIAGDKIMVKNGTKLSPRLKKEIQDNRDDIYQYLDQQQNLPLF